MWAQLQESRRHAQALQVPLRQGAQVGLPLLPKNRQDILQHVRSHTRCPQEQGDLRRGPLQEQRQDDPRLVLGPGRIADEETIAS
jgi:hypothetical protein